MTADERDTRRYDRVTRESAQLVALRASLGAFRHDIQLEGEHAVALDVAFWEPSLGTHGGEEDALGARELEAFLRHPLAARLSRLSIHAQPYARALVNVIAEHAPRTLERLSIGDLADVDLLAEQPAWCAPFERRARGGGFAREDLVVRYLDARPLASALPQLAELHLEARMLTVGEMKLQQLRRLTLRGSAFVRASADGLAASQLPSLLELELGWCGLRAAAGDSRADAAALICIALRPFFENEQSLRLTLVAPELGNALCARLPVDLPAAQSLRLELPLGHIDERGASAIAKHAEWFGCLRGLSLRHNLLSAADVVQLTQLLPALAWDEQHTDAPAPPMCGTAALGEALFAAPTPARGNELLGSGELEQRARRAARAAPLEPQERELLAAVRADPDSDAPRAIYADWLSERGDPRGELVVKQLQHGDAALVDRTRLMLRRKRAALLGPLADETDPRKLSTRLVRGFFEPPLCVDIELFERAPSQLLRWSPLLYVRGPVIASGRHEVRYLGLRVSASGPEATKVLEHRDELANPEQRANALALSRLSPCPGLIACEALAGEWNGERFYLVVEDHAGIDLTALTRRPLPLQPACELVAQLGRALQRLHASAAAGRLTAGIDALRELLVDDTGRVRLLPRPPPPMLWTPEDDVAAAALLLGCLLRGDTYALHSLSVADELRGDLQQPVSYVEALDDPAEQKLLAVAATAVLGAAASRRRAAFDRLLAIIDDLARQHGWPLDGSALASWVAELLAT
ncbi:MAG: TIGR02996 domain-containing protein [Myxococcales bacterium]|nr:TIGR02996 domain-containing protein [Myxococcales bacterium]